MLTIRPPQHPPTPSVRCQTQWGKLTFSCKAWALVFRVCSCRLLSICPCRMLERILQGALVRVGRLDTECWYLLSSPCCGCPAHESRLVEAGFTQAQDERCSLLRFLQAYFFRSASSALWLHRLLFGFRLWISRCLPVAAVLQRIWVLQQCQKK